MADRPRASEIIHICITCINNILCVIELLFFFFLLFQSEHNIVGLETVENV